MDKCNTEIYLELTSFVVVSQFDYYVRTPKVYESYLYYEKTLKAIDELVGLLA